MSGTSALFPLFLLAWSIWFLPHETPKFMQPRLDPGIKIILRVKLYFSLRNVRSFHIAAAKAALEAREKSPSKHIIDPGLHDKYEFKTALSGPFFDDLKASNIPAEQRIPPPCHWKNQTIIPGNQQIFALTQFFFVGYPILYPERLHITGASDEDLWAFNHLWAVLGYAIGIDDNFNVALQPDLTTAKKVYKEMFETFNIPNLFNMDRNTIALI